MPSSGAELGERGRMDGEPNWHLARGEAAITVGDRRETDREKRLFLKMAEIIEREALETRSGPPFPSLLQNHSDRGMRHRRFRPSIHSLFSSDFAVSHSSPSGRHLPFPLVQYPSLDASSIASSIVVTSTTDLMCRPPQITIKLSVK